MTEREEIIAARMQNTLQRLGKGEVKVIYSLSPPLFTIKIADKNHREKIVNALQKTGYILNVLEGETLLATILK